MNNYQLTIYIQHTASCEAKICKKVIVHAQY